MLEDVSLRKKNIDKLGETHASKEIVMTFEVFEKAVDELGLMVIQEQDFEDFRDKLNKVEHVGHIDGKTFSADTIEKAKRDLSKLIKVVKVDKRGKRTSVYVKSHADASEEHIKAAMEHDVKSREAAKKDDKKSMQNHDEKYIHHMAEADRIRDVAKMFNELNDHQKSILDKRLDFVKKERELKTFLETGKQKEVFKTNSTNESRNDVKKLPAGDYSSYYLYKQIADMHPDEKLNFDSESLTVSEIKDIIADSDRSINFKINESGDISTIEPEEEKPKKAEKTILTAALVSFLDKHEFTRDELMDSDYVAEKIENYAENVGIEFNDDELNDLVHQYRDMRKKPKVIKLDKKIDLNEGDKVMYHDHTDLISSRGGKGEGVEKRLGEIISMSHNGSMYIRDQKTGHNTYVKKPERHNIEKVVDASATTAKPEGKYQKSGERSTEHTHTDGTKYSQGDKVKFIGAGGKEMLGEFRHVNKNVHSPKGYAVIRGEDGKLYERSVDKVSKTTEK